MVLWKKPELRPTTISILFIFCICLIAIITLSTNNPLSAYLTQTEGKRAEEKLVEEKPADEKSPDEKSADEKLAEAKPVGVSPEDVVQPRVALCITGNIRTFIFPAVRQSMLQNITRVINQTHTVDTFFNVRFLDEPPPGQATPAVNKSADEIRAMIQEFDPVLVVELTEEDDFHPNQTLHRPKRLMERPAHCVHTSYTDCRIPFSLHRYMQCEKLISDYEKEHSLQYDYVYFTRPDMVFLDPIYPPAKVADNTVYTNMAPYISIQDFQNYWAMTHPEVKPEDVAPLTDQVLLGDRRSMKIASQSVNVTLNCDFYNMAGSRNPESVLSYWLLTNNVTTQAVPWLDAILRFDRLECHAINQIKLEEEKHKILSERCLRLMGEVVRPGMTY